MGNIISTTRILEQKQGLIFKWQYELFLWSLDSRYSQFSLRFQYQISSSSSLKQSQLLFVPFLNWIFVTFCLLELLWMESSGAACRIIFKSLQWGKFKSLLLLQHLLFLICLLSDITSLKSRVCLALGSVWKAKMSHSDNDSDVQSLNSPKALLYLKTECTLLWYILRPGGCSWALSQIRIILTLENCLDPSIVCSNLFLYSSD